MSDSQPREMWRVLKSHQCQYIRTCLCCVTPKQTVAVASFHHQASVIYIAATEGHSQTPIDSNLTPEEHGLLKDIVLKWIVILVIDINQSARERIAVTCQLRFAKPIARDTTSRHTVGAQLSRAQKISHSTICFSVI